MNINLLKKIINNVLNNDNFSLNDLNNLDNLDDD